MTKKGRTAVVVDYAARIPALSARMRKVQLENTDAIKLLGRVANLRHAVIYCDPPYTTAVNEPYLHSRFDKGAMLEVLRSQKGRVAVSGYADEWDELGWRVESFGTMHRRINGVSEGRVEKLWMNYPADGVLRL